jgi:RHS repeat-associated protein
VVTNVRLPGQYDERLLASVGLQGPYYNWNRWYLPGVGRYLELDPIGLVGESNGDFGPEWHGYSGQNPMTRVDPDGRYATTPPPVWTQALPFIPVIIVFWPGPIYRDPCENSSGGCVRPPKPPSPCSKLITCKYLSGGGKGPAPGETMRCTYTCEDGGRQWQVERRNTECPDEITVRVP